MGLGNLIASAIFIFHGLKGGLINRRVVKDHEGNYAIGKEAVYQGVFYLVIGIFFLVGAILIFASLYAKNKIG